MSYLQTKIADKLSESLFVEAPRGRYSPDLKGLVAFCASKPANAPYCFLDNGGCLLAQFFTACGMRKVCVGGYHYWGLDIPYTKLSDEFRQVAREEPRTFGAALLRARQALEGARS